MSYAVSYCCVSHTGRVRSLNQDSFVVGSLCSFKDCSDGELISGRSTVDRALLLGVFDGLGGEEYGEIASSIAASCATEAMAERGAVPDLLQLCHRMNGEICEYASSNRISSMGTTAAMLVFTKSGVSLANIGDSRIYRYRDRTLSQLSRDHVSFAVRGMKPPLYQNLGIPPDEMIIDPYLIETDCRVGDIYLICSDGLTDMVSDERISELISDNSPRESAEVLLNSALAAGGKDNITLILCKIEKKPCFLLKAMGLFSGKRDKI